MKASQILSGAMLIVAAQAQQGAWGQCGGTGWSGQTTCISGYSCVYSNPWYSQCLPGAAPPPTTVKTTTMMPTTISTPPAGCYTTTTTTSITIVTMTATVTSMNSMSSMTTMSTMTTSSNMPASTGFKWMGVDESGAEFGQANIPGVYGKDFIFPSLSSIDTLMSQGFNIFRLPFLMERMAPGSVSAPLSQAYLANYSVVVNHITSKGGWAIIDPHNYGRYDGNVITDTTAFQTFWNNVAGAFATNTHAIFDTNNEYHDEDQTLVLNMNQAAINGIRAAGATSQYIFVEGNSYSGAWTWAAINDNLKALTDPSNMIVYEMHQYLDSDGSGTSATCVSSTIGASRIASATQWLIANNKVGIIGEYAGGANPTCMSAVTGMLSAMEANSNVWLGALWWGGGPWWGNYIYGFEPPSSTGYNYYDSTLETYTPK